MHGKPGALRVTRSAKLLRVSVAVGLPFRAIGVILWITLWETAGQLR